MSQYEQKDNSGAIFVNDDIKSDKHPDRKGNAMIDGVDYWVSGWINESKNGKKYLSLKFQKKEDVHSNGVASVTKQVEQSLLDDDIPF